MNYENPVMFNGVPHRHCDCDLRSVKCARAPNAKRPLLTTEFARCLVPIPSPLLSTLAALTDEQIIAQYSRGCSKQGLGDWPQPFMRSQDIVKVYRTLVLGAE